LYIDALQSEKPDVFGLIRLYTQISRMRVLSSETVAASAERIVKRITDTYLEHAYPHSSAAMVCDLTTDTEVADGTRQG